MRFAWRVVVAATLFSMLDPIERAAAQNAIYVNNASHTIPSGGCNLREAIYAANFDSNIAIQSTDPDIFVATGCAAGNGHDTIVLPAGLDLPFDTIVDDAHNPYGPTGTPIVFSNITIEANGARLVRLDGDKYFRAFAVGYASIDLPGGTTVSGYGNLTIINAHIKNFSAVGGEGRCGGGGGLGAGGAIFVGIDGTLALKNSTLEGNAAIGGNAYATVDNSGTLDICRLGGGGGMGGNGGSGSRTNATGIQTGAGGGGGGSRGSGGDAFLDAGGSGGGTVTSGGSDFVAFKCGGAGGGSEEDGDDAPCPGGGGGGGGKTGTVFGGVPGDGGFGGGGGGAGYSGTIGKDGGAGGFGGGGGSCGGIGFAIATNGGTGGFGGGGGSCLENPGGGGLYGGRGDIARGGGGAGLGGAIFSLASTVTVSNSTFTGNYAVRGAPLCGPARTECGDAGAGSAANGADAGGAIFSYHSSLTVLNSTISRNASTGAFGGIAFDLRPLGTSGATLGPAFTDFTLHNTIIDHNGVDFNAPEECVIRGNGVTAVGSGNLIMQNASSGACPGVVAASDPQLLSLRINEPGSTPTMGILVGSPAQDAGDAGTAPATDQRGVTRPQLGGIDIGAYEARAPSFLLSVIPALSIDVGGFGSVAVTVGSFENFNAPVLLTVAPPPPGITASLAPNAVTPPANGSASSTLTVTLGPLVTAGSYTPMVIATSSGFSFSAPAVITVNATAAGIMTVIGAMKATGCIDNAGIVNTLNVKLAAAGASATAGRLRAAGNMLNALSNEIAAQTSKHITPPCAAVLITNLQALGAGWTAGP